MLVVALTGYNQHIEEIKEYNNNAVAQDVAMDDSGNVYIAGHHGADGLLIKLDSNGNEQWYKRFDQYTYMNDEAEFFRVLADSTGIYVHGGVPDVLSQQSVPQFITKFDHSGNEIWINEVFDDDPSATISGYPSQMMLLNNSLYVLHRSNGDYFNLAKFSRQTGTHEILGHLNRFVWMETPPPFLGGRWVFTNDTSAVDMSVDGTPDITELPYDSVGILFGVSTSSFLTYLNRYNWNSSISDGINTPYISWYDMGWQKVIDKKVKTPLSNNHNTVSTTIKKTEISNEFGVLIGSITGYYNSGTWTSFNLFSQINPDNGETVWDTLVPNDASLHLMSQNKNSRKIVSVGYTGSSNTGIKVWKINLPSIPFQTEYVSDEQDIPGKVNQSDITVYPNPSNNYFNLKSNKRIKQVSVYDLHGSVIMQKRIDSKRSRIQLESVGVHLMRIEDVDGNITTKKVVKR
jgi:hypothetical protein